MRLVGASTCEVLGAPRRGQYRKQEPGCGPWKKQQSVAAEAELLEGEPQCCLNSFLSLQGRALKRPFQILSGIRG